MTADQSSSAGLQFANQPTDGISMPKSMVEQAWYRRFRPAVPLARTKARLLAAEWGLAHLADSLEWLVSEVVTNAITHGRARRSSRVLVTYHLADGFLRVEVRDWASGMPRLTPVTYADLGGAELPESGRGLAIVAALADRWGVIPRVIGKSVWFEIALDTSSEGTP